MLRGIRGAVTVPANTKDTIREATQRLLQAMMQRNHLVADDLASVFFTATPDLDAEVPARAAREMGWTAVPLFCMQEMAVQDGLPRCIRVMFHVNTDKKPHEIQHVYLGEAASLRPDLAQGGMNDGRRDAPPGHRSTEGTRS